MGLDQIRLDQIRLDAGQRDTTGQKVKGQKGQTNTHTNKHTYSRNIYIDIDRLYYIILD